MLFKLAKELRNMGFDAEFISKKNTEILKQIAIDEDRIIITRD